jgi:beta-1,4-mannosyltransferase
VRIRNRRRRSTQPLRVLQSFPEPRPTTNPYVVMLRDQLQLAPGVEVDTFTWSRALLGRYDVFHVHWAEVHLLGPHPLKVLARQLLFLAVLLRLRARGTALVRTLHNLRPQEDVPGRVRRLLELTDRWTTLYIRLNPLSALPEGAASVTVPHGHYRDWFAGRPRAPRAPGRLVFAGLIRPYKNVEGLIEAFRGTSDPGLSLSVAGNPAMPELAAAVRAASDGDPRISLRLEHLTDADLVEVISSAQLVALPYRDMHNSGAALLALSLDRPVLVPDNDVTAGLAAEVGPGWVLRYAGELSTETLVGALAQAEELGSGERPDLSRREWSRSVEGHLAAYRQAVDLRRGRRRSRGSGSGG